jgi:hypothetical protein
MRINIFEGSRRIRLLLQILWVVGVLVNSWNNNPSVWVTYQTYGPDYPFIKANESSSSCESNDHSEWFYTQTKNGTSVSLTLCFKAQEFNNGLMLVPYKTDANDKGKIWGNSVYSSEVSNYAERRKRLFKIPLADEQWIDEQGKKKITENITDGVGYAFSGFVAIWLVGTVIGWIVRGFMGVPRGQDTRPEKSEETSPSD